MGVNTGASLNSTALEGKLHGTPQDELIKTAFLANRLSGRGNNSDLLLDMKPNPIPGRHFSGGRPVIDADGFNPLSNASSNESKVQDHLNHFPSLSSRHLTADEGVNIGFPNNSPSNLPLPSFYHLSDDPHPKTSVSDNFAANTWLVNPPAPSDSGAHLRTGRVHEIKVKVIPERAMTTSYMDQALRQLIGAMPDASVCEFSAADLGACKEISGVTGVHLHSNSISVRSLGRFFRRGRLIIAILPFFCIGMG
ncbi:unnamed protein product [Schistocephalus solidus]|uniref:Auxin-responsive protein n=1 Tax=Schistocephalus solidus TaxID=70667 RepID=A0A183T073_SCHSO|nr:unnamed protein product [Schistocephalus solidus]